MEKKEISDRKYCEFYEESDFKSPFTIFLFILFSLGLYILYWIYSSNFKLSKIDEDAPNPNRGLIILFLIPLIWFSIIKVFEYLLFPQFEFIVRVIEIIGWFLIVFLSMKYVYDFCISYGNITNSEGLIWYLFLYPGYFALILLLFNFYYTIPLIGFPVITIIAMQNLFNKRAKICYQRSESLAYRTMIREGES